MNDKTADADRIMAGWQETIREVEANKDGFVEIPRKRIVTTPTQAMTEITQADRDAAAEAFFCKPLLNEKHNDDRRVRAFARHRQYGYDQGYYDGRKYDGANERAKIVAWLRSVDDPDERWALQNSHWYADEIEAGEHETFTHPDNV